MPDYVVDLDLGDETTICVVAIRAHDRIHAAMKARALARSRWHASDPYVASVESYATTEAMVGPGNVCDYDLRHETDPELS